MKHKPQTEHRKKMKQLITLLTKGLLPQETISEKNQQNKNVRITKDNESARKDRLSYTSKDIRRKMEIKDQHKRWNTNNRKQQEKHTANYTEKYEKQKDIIQNSTDATEYAMNANKENNKKKILIREDNGE